MKKSIPVLVCLFLACVVPRVPAQLCVTPPSDLISWWTGDQTRDDHFGTNHATFVGGASFHEDEWDQWGFILDGTTGFLEVSNSPGLNPVNEITVMAWIYPITLSTSAQGPCSTLVSDRIVDKSTANGRPDIGGDGYNLDILDGRLRFIVGNVPSAQYGWFLGKTQITPRFVGAEYTNRYWHVAATYDGRSMKLYVNGELDGILLLPYYQSIPTNTLPLRIGADSTGTNNFFHGIIDEVAIFGRALRSNEIRAIYSAGANGMCKDPLITVHPRSQGRGRGENVTFSVVVHPNSTVPLFYQWQKDGQPIVGATNATLELTNIQTADEGFYRVVVSNSRGSVTSVSAQLLISWVSIDLYAGVTIRGVVGETYGIQYTTNVDALATNWTCRTNLVFSQPVQMWYDSEPATHPKRFYYVTRPTCMCCTNRLVACPAEIVCPK